MAEQSFDVAVVGAGFAGIAMAIALRELGLSFVLLERADEVGGTWRDNRYPGAACDVPAHLYSFSFAPRVWSRRFPGQPEILDYARSLVREHRLAPHLRLCAGVQELRFEGERWRVTLEDGSSLRARFVVSAVGQLSRPFVPTLPGSFAGQSFHSARWPRAIELSGKTVAVIGSGASALQIVPRIAGQAGRLLVFQRSAPYVLPKSDRAYRSFERLAFSALPALAKLDRLGLFVASEVLASALLSSGPQRALLRLHALLHMKSQLRGRDDLVEACTPRDAFGCKRVVFADDWYPTLRAPNVALIADEIVALSPGGVRTARGQQHEIDVLIYCTGFRATELLAPMQVFGRGGRSLQAAWAHGAHAYRGISVSGFPNLLMLYGPNTNVGSTSILYMLEAQVRYVRAALAHLSAVGARTLEVRPAAEARFADWVATRSRETAWESGCHSWYTVEGKNTNNWPGFATAYALSLRRFDPEHYDLA